MSQNPYESPIRAELVERPRKLKPLPVVSLTIVLLSVLVACMVASIAFPWPPVFIATGIVAMGSLVGLLAFMACYDLFRWYQSSK